MTQTGSKDIPLSLLENKGAYVEKAEENTVKSLRHVSTQRNMSIKPMDG